MRCCRRCGIAGSERVPPALLSWYFILGSTQSADDYTLHPDIIIFFSKHFCPSCNTTISFSFILEIKWSKDKKLTISANKSNNNFDLTYRHENNQTCRHTDIQKNRVTDTNINTHTHWRIHTDIQIYRHTGIKTYRHTGIYVDIHTYMHIHTCRYTDIRINIYGYAKNIEKRSN